MFKEWIISLIGIVALMSVFYAVAPEGRTKKIVKILFAFVMLLYLVEPIKYLSEIDNLTSFFGLAKFLNT